MSSLVWIDFDSVERDRAQRILDLFGETDTRDELGLGALRDSIADHLFPGTSTIQTRLRYMLFVPWLLGGAVDGAASPRAAAERARAREIALIAALRRGGETVGVIGRDAGAGLKRLPSDTYWSGLGAWGLRRFPGPKSGYFDAAVAARGRRAREEGGGGPAFWAPGLPVPPEDLEEATHFALTRDEADFLIDRLVRSCSESLLAVLAREGDAARCAQVWEHPALGDLPPRLRDLVVDGARVSALMHGAALLYNLMLAERRGREDWSADYRDRITGWAAGTDLAEIRGWDLDALWAAAEHPAHAVRPQTRRFVEEWREAALATAGAVADDPAARRLVETRETRLKGAKSRFINKGALDRWGGAAGTARLSFRWAEASAHLKDLADAA